MSEEKKPLPGYAGFVPKSSDEIMPYKTAMNARMPLEQRTVPLQATKRATSVPANNGEEARGRIRSYFLPKRFTGTTTYTQQTVDYVKSSADVPPRAKEPKNLADSVALPKFVAKTEKQVTCGTATGGKADFFSTVRKIEREDDDARKNVTIAPTRSGAAHNLRTVDIMRKRENAAELAPQKEQLVKIAKRPLNGLPPASVTEQVKLTGLPPQPSNRTEYGDPKSGMSFLMATAEKEQSPLRKQNKLMTLTATTRDMFAGTAKDREDVIPGYQGHVPAARGNIGRIQGDNEILRSFSKCSVRLAQPNTVETAQESPLRIRKPVSEMTAVEKNTMLTAAARAAEEAVADIGGERKMNKRDGTGRKNAVRGFFSQGEGQADSVIADQFCAKYRPLEGAMKMGAPSTRNWTTEKELRRRITM